MKLGHPFEAIVHYLLIIGIVGLGCQDGVPIMSVLICMVTHWT